MDCSAPRQRSLSVLTNTCERGMVSTAAAVFFKKLVLLDRDIAHVSLGQGSRLMYLMQISGRRIFRQNWTPGSERGKGCNWAYMIGCLGLGCTGRTDALLRNRQKLHSDIRQNLRPVYPATCAQLSDVSTRCKAVLPYDDTRTVWQPKCSVSVAIMVSKAVCLAKL